MGVSLLVLPFSFSANLKYIKTNKLSLHYLGQYVFWYGFKSTLTCDAKKYNPMIFAMAIEKNIESDVAITAFKLTETPRAIQIQKTIF
ncbi:MAG: hypothetical protein ACJAXS_002087 [Colwellia sp.]|jgi:hypothetical protein